MTGPVDWIALRAECSPTAAFQQIKIEVKSDLELRNAKSRPGCGYGFKMVGDGNTFTVFLDGGGVLPKSVCFTKTPKGLAIRNGADDSLMLNAEVCLSDEGKCRLRIDGKEKEFWQVRYMALEDLFFGDIFSKSGASQ